VGPLVGPMIPSAAFAKRPVASARQEKVSLSTPSEFFFF